MAQKRSRKARREAQEHEKKQRRLLVAGAIGVLVLMAAGFAILRGQNSAPEIAAAELFTAPTVGALAPDFELVSSKGELVKLNDFRGRPAASTRSLRRLLPISSTPLAS